MTATLERPADQPTVKVDASQSARRTWIDPGEAITLLAVLTLLIAACLPMARVYVGLDFLRPVLAAVFLSVGLSWALRRVGAGPVWALVASFIGWLVFVSTAFLAETLWGGFVPTARTVGAGANLWARGMQLVMLRPAPTFAEAGLLLITVTGVWAIAHAVEGMVFRLRAPLQAIAVALVLWTVPLALAPPNASAWPWAVTILSGAAFLLLTFVGRDVAGWPGADSRTRAALYPTGAAIAGTAIVVGVLLASSLPGYGNVPWFETRGIGGTTLTTNPIVDIRARLVAGSSGPVLHISTPRPLYLRVTSLDTYSENEEWTNAGIQGSPVDGSIPVDAPVGARETVRVSIRVDNLREAVLVPAPYQVADVAGDVSSKFQYDRRNATLTLDNGASLNSGDRYSVIASVPAPTAEALQSVADVRADPVYTQLPANVPPDVVELARRIATRANAATPFEQALAIQDELRRWTYSTDPPQGHSARAMEQFLQTRTGYCEQFAGTMAVMLRSLGLPARVAVGYSPGELLERGADVASGTYVITNANAHAWVEVLFPTYGWISFEPTPRSDGNVLVPSATNLAPERTVRQSNPSGSQSPNVNVDRDLPRNTPFDSSEAAVPPVPAPSPGGGAGSGLPWGVLLSLLAVAAAATIAFSIRRGHELDLVPSGGVLRARDRVERLGRGLGISPRPSDTDLEYLTRVAERAGGGPARAAAQPLARAAAQPLARAAAQPLARTAARRLAAATAAARYAPLLPASAAADATAAGDELVGQLLTGIPVWRRPLVRLRGGTTALLAGATWLAWLRRLPYRSLLVRRPSE